MHGPAGAGIRALSCGPNHIAPIRFDQRQADAGQGGTEDRQDFGQVHVIRYQSHAGFTE
ncbi:hypothetical protein DSECCO2_401360 [anaerobic digester metagenome]